ncbi:MAG TPA: hypothetical protein ENL07_11520 [Chlorobaculum parvum]|uniref:Methylmalonyl-CoA mutase alpha/beta chain catalytic domain-containing protein n=1 Tax=Chlorobaculum parvum TaxID=274539 RepID=A0A7C5DI44_9CHLB|nr:hypothetical protein [Chlorobaculum parvum]
MDSKWSRGTTATPQASSPDVPFRRASNRWRICQQIAVTRLLDDPELLADAVSGGADAIELRFEGVPENAEIERLLDALRQINLSRIALYVSGSIGDPALLFDALAALEADLPLPTTEIKGSGFRTIAVDTVRFHHAGATVAQELAFALAGLSDCLDRMTDAGVDAAEAASTIEIVVACGTTHLPELAKLRALRAIWPQLLGAWGVPAETMPEPRLFVRASSRSFSVLDPYTNILRLSTEALSAILGGCDTLQVTPFDPTGSLSPEFSDRIARNIQLLFRKESTLDRVVDPAAGSYYIETLTSKLGREAWRIFASIQSEGGFREAEANGFISSLIASSAEVRQKEIDTRRRTLVGINRYTVPPSPEVVNALQPQANVTEINGYEQLRMRMIAHAATGDSTPCAVLWQHGDSAKSQRVASFAEDFLQSGGFEVLPGMTLDATHGSCEAILADNPQVVVLCWASEESFVAVPEVCAAIHETDRECVVIMAAKPPAQADELLQAGLDRFIYNGCEAFDELLSLQHKTGVL